MAAAVMAVENAMERLEAITEAMAVVAAMAAAAMAVEKAVERTLAMAVEAKQVAAKVMEAMAAAEMAVEKVVEKAVERWEAIAEAFSAALASAGGLKLPSMVEVQAALAGLGTRTKPVQCTGHGGRGGAG
jgi:NifU-like protein involved in Fe-S cluster formation